MGSMPDRGGGIRPIEADLSTAALARANEANAVAFCDWSRHTPGVVVDDRPGRFRISTGVPHSVFNGVRSTHLPPSEADAYIDETRAYFAAMAEPWLWWVWPGSGPDDLPSRLTARGLVSRASLPAMSVDLRALREDWPWPEGLKIVRVANIEELEEWVGVAGPAFGLGAGPPTRRYLAVFSASGFEAGAPMQFYVGYLDGLPVAASQMFLGAGVAGIYTVATIPEHRGRGFGKALTVAPLRDARGRGYRWAILQATKIGEPVYVRLGFRIDGRVEFYGPPPAPA